MIIRDLKEINSRYKIYKKVDFYLVQPRILIKLFYLIKLFFLTLFISIYFT